MKRGGKPDGYLFNAASKLVGIVELKHTDMGQAEDDLHVYAQNALDRRLPADDVSAWWASPAWAHPSTRFR